jgi:uncharacterized protein (TIGR02594 family)
MSFRDDVISIQSRVGVTADGVFGPATASAVLAALGNTYTDCHAGAPPPQPVTEPRWITLARLLLGTREIPGPQHNGFIASGWARLGAAWFNDDETPWCGFFVAHCMDAAGLPYPGKGEFARAAAWANYGVPCAPQLGAIGVKKRQGGNHVFFIVGETADKRFYKALSGNQGNMVSIVDIAKSDVFAVRWPAGVPQANRPLPVLPRGTLSGSEA